MKAVNSGKKSRSERTSSRAKPRRSSRQLGTKIRSGIALQGVFCLRGAPVLGFHFFQSRCAFFCGPVEDVGYFQTDEKYTRVALEDSEVLIRKPIREKTSVICFRSRYRIARPCGAGIDVALNVQCNQHEHPSERWANFLAGVTSGRECCVRTRDPAQVRGDSEQCFRRHRFHERSRVPACQSRV